MGGIQSSRSTEYSPHDRLTELDWGGEELLKRGRQNFPIKEKNPDEREDLWEVRDHTDSFAVLARHFEGLLRQVRL